MKKITKPVRNKKWTKQAKKRKVIVDEKLQKAVLAPNAKTANKKSLIQKMIETVLPSKAANADQEKMIKRKKQLKSVEQTTTFTEKIESNKVQTTKKKRKKAKKKIAKKPSSSRQTVSDPYASREAKHYENPIASREYILAFLKQADVPLSFRKLAKGLGYGQVPEQKTALSRRVNAMIRDGQLLQNDDQEYTLIDDASLVRGRVSGHRDGFGFLTELSDNRKDIYLTPRQMRGVFPGDDVIVHPGNRRKEATIVEVVSRNTQEIVGRCVESSNRHYDWMVIPMNTRIAQSIYVNPTSKLQPELGQIVVIQITEYPTYKSVAAGNVIETLVQQSNVKLTIDIGIRMHDLPYQWNKAVLEEVSQLPEAVSEQLLVNRRDLRALPFVTIDGADAKDFDDAVFCQANASQGWTLFVAIADVSHYVQPHSALDEAAYERGNSVYFPGKVVPMLPEVLSNGLCSLKPGVNRLALVCEMQFDQNGELQNYQFDHAMIHSHARLIYDDVSDVLTQTTTWDDPEKQALLPHLQCLNDLYNKLQHARTCRGALDLEFTEPYFEFDEKGDVSAIKSRKRSLSHRIIEECMLVANVCAAKFVAKREIPSLFRIHHRPPAEKLAQLREFISVLGLELKGGDEPLASDYATLLSHIKSRDDAILIQIVMLRSLSQAIYGPDNDGHFALAYDAYGHFTSPIRRYPDLIMHRAISHIVQKKPSASFPYSAQKMAQFGEHCSVTERRADEVTRHVINTLKCQFMENKLGQTYQGMIINVTNFGFFVELDQIFVEGLVHITHLNDDHYVFDPAFHRLVGRRKKKAYALGDRVEVEVLNVNPGNQRIELGLGAC